MNERLIATVPISSKDVDNLISAGLKINTSKTKIRMSDGTKEVIYKKHS